MGSINYWAILCSCLSRSINLSNNNIIFPKSQKNAFWECRESNPGRLGEKHELDPIQYCWVQYCKKSCHIVLKLRYNRYKISRKLIPPQKISSVVMQSKLSWNKSDLSKSWTTPAAFVASDLKTFRVFQKCKLAQKSSNPNLTNKNILFWSRYYNHTLM